MNAFVVTHNPEWAARFREECQNIKSAAAVEVDLHHIGSTAVPNMFAKDCIDMPGVVEKFENGNALVEPLEALGFEYRGEYGIKGRHYVAKSGRRKVHLHVFERGSKEIDKHLHFVLAMSTNPALVEEFNSIKRRLVELYPGNRSRYQQEKTFFYEKVAAMGPRPWQWQPKRQLFRSGCT